MADNSLVLKNSSVAGKIPLPANLAQAELAVNTADKALYSKNSAGEIIELGVPHSHVGAGDAAHALATTTKAGFLSATDKIKIDGFTGSTVVNASAVTTALGFTPADQASTFTKTETDARIQTVIGGISPATLDTISELAAQMQADESGVGALITTVSAVQVQIDGLTTAVQNVGIVNNTVDGGTFYGITP